MNERDVFENARNYLETVWPGQGKGLARDERGRWRLIFLQKDIADHLAPLRCGRDLAIACALTFLHRLFGCVCQPPRYGGETKGDA